MGVSLGADVKFPTTNYVGEVDSGRGSNFRSGPDNLSLLDGRMPLPESTSPAKSVVQSLKYSVN